MIGPGTVLLFFGGMLCLSPVLVRPGVGIVLLGLLLVLIGSIDRAFRKHRSTKAAPKPLTPEPLDYALYTPFSAGGGTLHDAARTALLDAKRAGYVISASKNEAIVLRKGDEEVIFRSNADVIEWGRKSKAL